MSYVESLLKPDHNLELRYLKIKNDSIENLNHNFILSNQLFNYMMDNIFYVYYIDIQYECNNVQIEKCKLLNKARLVVSTIHCNNLKNIIKLYNDDKCDELKDYISKLQKTSEDNNKFPKFKWCYYYEFKAAKNLKIIFNVLGAIIFYIEFEPNFVSRNNYLNNFKILVLIKWNKPNFKNLRKKIKNI